MGWVVELDPTDKAIFGAWVLEFKLAGGVFGVYFESHRWQDTSDEPPDGPKDQSDPEC